MLNDIINTYNDEELKVADGLDDAVIGILTDTMQIVYSKKKCVDILVSEGLRRDEAIEYLEFNTYCAYVGDKTPIWVDDDF